LDKGSHHCKHLQNAWNLYGAAEFDFIIIKQSNTTQQLLEIEQKWIDKYWGTGMLYNACPVAGTTAGLKRSPLSIASKKKISEARKGKGLGNKNGCGNVPWNKGKTNVYTKETLQVMSTNLKGKPAWNKGLKLGAQISFKVCDTCKQKFEARSGNRKRCSKCCICKNCDIQLPNASHAFCSKSCATKYRYVTYPNPFSLCY
jgi:hypothetical protein